MVQPETTEAQSRAFLHLPIQRRNLLRRKGALMHSLTTAVTYLLKVERVSAPCIFMLRGSLLFAGAWDHAAFEATFDLDVRARKWGIRLRPRLKLIDPSCDVDHG